MRSSAIRIVLLVVGFGFCSAVSAGSLLSPGVGRIASLFAISGYDILRIQYTTDSSAGFKSFNPAGCTVGPDVFDVQLDVAGRSDEEQRQLLNAINLAFMTNRNVNFFVRDDLCSTAGTSSQLRIVTGVQVLN
jgi:hypothetical protein